MNNKFILVALLNLFCFVGFSQSSPSFTGGATQSLTICENASSYVIDNYFPTYDASTGLVLTYSIKAAPSHGTLHGFPGSGSSNGSVFSPSGFNYSPTSNYSGTDAFAITVSNGVASATTTISVTINPLPTVAAITGTNYACRGTSKTLSDATKGGKWSSSNDLGASIDSLTGVVSALAVGSFTISYTVTNATTGCSNAATTTFSVSAYPFVPGITGTSPICAGTTTTFSNVTSGGIWTSSNKAIATIDSTSGLITSIASGTSSITYSVTNSYGCTSTSSKNIVVSTSPTVAAITSTSTSLCIGATATLTETTTGGTWSSSNTSIATVATAGFRTATVTAVSAGTDTILYTVTNGTGCSTSSKLAITVAAKPVIGALTGNTNVCVASSSQLASTTTGGTWASSNTAVATVNSSGLVTGVAAGTANIIYTVTNGTGCSSFVFASITVSTSPAVSAITGTNSLCVSSTSQLANATTGGTWSSRNTTIATVDNNGLVTGVALGKDTISYAVTNAGGCTTTVTYAITVNSALSVSAISGSSTACTGTVTTLTDATTGGTWSSSNTSVATIDATTGIVTPLVAGFTVIKYTVGSGTCTNSASGNLTVNTSPSITANSVSTLTLCSSDSSQITNATSGGVWTSSNTSVATVSQTGKVKPVTTTTTKTATISYTITNASGCAAVSATTLTVNPSPNSFTISGSDATCRGTNLTYTTTSTGGTWSSSNTAVATITNFGGTNGRATTLSVGTTTIAYTVTNGSCSAVSSISLDVATSVSVSPIDGAATACVGTSVTYTDSTTSVGAGGGATATWSVTNGTGAATIVANTGVLTPTVAGTVTITYTVTNGRGCTGTATKTITIYAAPTVGAISGAATVCTGSTITLSDATSGGKWTSANALQASVDSSTGVVTGIAATNSVNINYTVTNVGGCSATVNYPIRVNAGTVISKNTPATSSLCVGSTVTITNGTANGYWSSNNTSVATVNSSTGVVTAVKAGTATIQYVVVNGVGCSSVANTTVTVNTLPTLSVSTGTASACVGASSQLYNTSTIPSGGSAVWSSSNTLIASVNSASGVVAGVAAGTSKISYKITNSNGCADSVSTSFTVNANPTVAAITSPSSTVCVGSKLQIADATSGGTWGINDITKATISTAGLVTGIAVGDVIVTYSVTQNGCTTTVIANGTVEPLPVVAAITGTTTFCQGSTIKLADATASGVWASSNTSIATVDATGTVTGVSGGTTNITYTVTSAYGCATTVTKSVTINALPLVAAITGNAAICFGSTTTLADATTGGVWSSSNTSIAKVSAGTITTVATGVDTISYTVTNSNGCVTTVTKQITVNATPSASFTVNKNSQCISGNLFVFTNTSTISAGSVTYSWTIDGKTFTTTSPTYTFTSAGKYTIKLVVTSGTGCADSTIQNVTVNPKPTPSFSINTANQCLTGNSYVFTNASTISSGKETFIWSFGDGSSASIATSPTYSYTKAGTYTVQLTATSDSSCVDSTSQTVVLTANVTPTLSISASATSICAGTSVTFTATPTNGGANPTYQWKKNGNNVGTNSSTYSDNSLANNDALTCVMTSSVTCVTATTATSNSIKVAVAAYATPTVSVAATATSICKGTSVTFTATPTNGGTTPSYQWQKNGLNVGSGLTTYTDASLVNGDKITCILTSSVTCVTARTVTSTAVTMKVNQPSTSTTTASFCFGSSYTFNGSTYTSAGTYVKHLTNSVGCDSAATLVLTVKAISTSTTTASICSGGSYTFNGSAYTSAGTYIAHLTNSVGCDSAATLVLTVKATSTSTTTASICSGGSYTFNGSTYTSAGTYVKHLTNSVGCDSAATLVLTVKAISTSTTTASICTGGSYTFNGSTYTSAGTYIAHLTNSVGCDSAATLVLSVKPTSTSTTTASICFGGSYTFNGSTYTSAGTYVKHLTNSVGCDSAATLVLAVKATSTSTTTASICSGGSYTFNGSIYTSAGTYTAHLTNSVGCDSAAILVLSVKPTSTSTTTASICAGTSYTFNGSTYTSAGTYVKLLTNSVGCDSAATLVLSVKPTSTSSTIARICSGGSYTFNGSTYTSAGTYVKHLTNSVGCDSAATLILSVKPTSTSTTTASICFGSSYTFNGSTYTSAGTYVAHLTNSVSCDSAATLVLNVKPTSTSTTTASICSGSSYAFNGSTYTSAGTYVAHLTNSVGCDSAATLVLTVNSTSTSTTTANICSGGSYTFNGSTYTTAGTYVKHLTNSVGCDSAATLILSVKQTSTSTTTASICSGGSYTFNGFTYISAGTYIAHLTNSVGCDSAATLVLSVKPTSTSTTTASICSGTSYTFNGSTYTSAGTYIAHLTNSLGCDSAATLVLSVKQTSTSTTTASICSGGSYTFNGSTYTSAGTYIAHLTNSVGCDSAATLVLTVKPTSTSTSTASICSGGSYTFNGSTYTTAGTYTAHLTNSVGCDSAATLVLTIKPTSTSTTTASICSGGSYTFNGSTYTSAGTYIAHLTNSVGCDSAATLVISIKATSTSTTTASICSGGSYIFNGSTYTSAGTYIAHLTNSLGCDSAATLVLTIKPTSTSATTASICSGGSYIFNGSTYTSAGTYIAHLTNSLGCDSAATLVLTVKSTSTSTTTANICSGGSYTFNGSTYTSAGTYTAHLTNSVGCDSAATLVLSFKPTSTSTTTASICLGGSYTFNGSTYTSAGTYVKHLTNSAGCDSAATLVLTVKPTSTSTTTASFCTGGSYTFNGSTYNTAGTYTAHLTNSVGCDSTATLVLSVKSPTVSTSTASICTGSSYTFNGVAYTTVGTYIAHLTNSVGCDSIASLVLTVKANSSSTTSASIKLGDSYLFNGTSYTASGTYTAHLTNSVGCDSVATLVLTVNNPTSSSVNASICSGSSYLFNGTSYSTDGTYTTHLTNAAGGDSIVTLVLVVNMPTTSTTTASICSGTSYIFNGTTYTIAGTYTSHLTNSVGCDSAATLVLTVKPTSTSTTSASICSGGSYTFNGSTYTSAGTYIAHLTNSVGCDSTATLVLTIKSITASTTTASICSGSSYIFNGSTYTSVGTYTAHLTNSVGCDSTATLVLTIKSTSASTTTASICSGGSYNFNGSTYTSAGTYIAHLTNSAGCDSVATLVLTVKPTSTSTTTASICSGSSYTFNGSAYTNAGTYTVHLTNSVGCDSTATLVLTVKAITSSTVKASICSGNAYTFNGSSYASAGTYTAHLTNSVGCDSIATLILTVNSPSASTSTASICSGSSYTFNGTAYDVAGTYTAHLTNAVECDSVATLVLTVKATSTSTTSASIKQGESYTFNGTVYTASGTYTAHLTNAAGCDSIATLVLSVIDPTSSTVSASICSGSSYTFNGTVYTTAGTYTAHLTNAAGGDSTATLILTVNSASASTTTASICSGSSYTFNGTAYDVAGTYTAHLTNAAGCDSVATLVLTVKPTSTSTTSASIKQSDSYTFNGTVYTASGTYTAHLTNAAGCDSTATLVLSVIDPTSSIVKASICSGSSYTFNGTTYTTAGTYTALLKNAAGGDSTVTLILTVNSSSASTTTASICSGSSYTFNGTAYSVAGTYTAHLTNAVGCDSVATLVLTVKANSTSTTSASIKKGDSYTFNGTVYTASGTYTAHLTNAAGCDSIATLVLSVIDPTSSTVKASICSGSSYSFNGTTYTTAGTYTSHLTNAAGGDSTATLILTVNSPSASTSTASICSGSIYTFNGTAYDVAGTYTVHLTNAVGCDSVATLVLTVKATSTSTTSASIKKGDSYTFNGTAYTVSGTYTANLTNAAGCDSTATLVLSVIDPTSSIVKASICSGSSYTFNGTTYTTAGTYTALLKNAAGGDSTATLILTVNSSSASTTNASICSGSSYTFNGTAYSVAGTYTSNLTNALGCDSVATLVLSVKATSTSTTSASIKQGGSYTFNGTTYTASGTYTVNLTNAAGCDSIATLVLSVIDPTSSTVKASICSGSSYTFNGTTYTTAGTYTALLKNAAGGDSTATLILTVNSSSASTTNASICSGSSYTFNGTAYSVAGTYTAHLTNAVGCDSVATLILIVNKATSSTTNDTIVKGRTYTFNGNVYTAAGTYIVHLTNAAGCDSIATLVLTEVQVVPVSFMSFYANYQEGITRLNWSTANEVNTAYYVVQRSENGVDFVSLNKMASANKVAGSNYNYKDAVTTTGKVYYRIQLVDRSGVVTCSNIISVSIRSNFSFALYPNPVKSNLTLHLENDKAENVTLQVVNLLGKIVKQQQAQLFSGVTDIKLDVSNLAQGSYMIVVKGESTHQQQFIKF